VDKLNFQISATRYLLSAWAHKY